MEVSLYCCYSANLKKYLIDNGLRYKIAAKNPNSLADFWVFVRDEKLDRLLNQWAARKTGSSFYVENYGGNNGTENARAVCR